MDRTPLSSRPGSLQVLREDVSCASIGADRLQGLLKLLAADKITGKIAKEVFAKMFETDDAPDKIVASMGVEQINDEGAVEAIVTQVIAENPGQVEQFKGGKDKLFGFFVGQVMKVSRGQANPQLTQEILRRKLAE